MRARMMEPAGLHRGNPPRPTAHTTTASRSLLSVIVLYPWASSGDLRAAPAAPPRAQWSPRLAPCPRAKLACQIPAGPNTCRARTRPIACPRRAQPSPPPIRVWPTARPLPGRCRRPRWQSRIGTTTQAVRRQRRGRPRRCGAARHPGSSRVALMEETSPSTVVLCRGRKRRGRKSPARSGSNSIGVRRHRATKAKEMEGARHRHGRLHQRTSDQNAPRVIEPRRLIRVRATQVGQS